MADKDFNVQDIFAPHDIKINMSAFFAKHNRLYGSTLIKAFLLSKRMHIEHILDGLNEIIQNIVSAYGWHKNIA